MNTKTVLLVGILVGIAVMGVAFVGPQIFYQASAQPIDNVYLPLILREILQAVSTASGPLQVFPSSGTTHGDIGGRSELGGMCTITDPDSHLVTLEEIEKARIETGVIWSSFAGEIWLDNGELGTLVKSYDTPPGSDWDGGGGIGGANCEGWTSTDGGFVGTTILANGSGLSQLSCNNVARVACGKH